jgi:hypothetical protein
MAVNKQYLAVGAVAVLAVAFFARRGCNNEKVDEAKPAAEVTPGRAAANPNPRAPKHAPVAKAPTALPMKEASKTLLKLGWGGGKGQVGREAPPEGSSMGPMSLSVDKKGRPLVLDQVNGRLVRFVDGKPDLDLRVAPTAQDVVVADNGSIAVLDRHGSKDISLFDDSGREIGKLPLVGEGIESPGVVTSMFVEGNDVYAEEMHDTVVKIGSVDGTPANPRTAFPGRPSRDGKTFLRAAIVDRDAGRATVTVLERPSGEKRFTRPIQEQGPLLSIVLLDSDKKGMVYFAAEVQATGYVVALTCIDPAEGEIVGGATLPANTMPDETFRDFQVLDEGGLIYAVRTDAGVTYERFDCGGN